MTFCQYSPGGHEKRSSTTIFVGWTGNFDHSLLLNKANSPDLALYDLEQEFLGDYIQDRGYTVSLWSAAIVHFPSQSMSCKKRIVLLLCVDCAMKPRPLSAEFSPSYLPYPPSPCLEAS